MGHTLVLLAHSDSYLLSSALLHIAKTTSGDKRIQFDGDGLTCGKAKPNEAGALHSFRTGKTISGHTDKRMRPLKGMPIKRILFFFNFNLRVKIKQKISTANQSDAIVLFV